MRASTRKFLIWVSLTLLFLIGIRLLHKHGLRLSVLVIPNDDEENTVLRRRAGYSHNQQDAPGGAPAYAAGTYMAGQRPSNRSFCSWQYQLPNLLSYPATKVHGTPEHDLKSSYRVLEAVVSSESTRESLPPITLCTHATADQVYGIVELARRWDGPLSLAIFTPGLDAGLAVALLDRACRCEPAMSKVFVHLVFPAGRPPTLGQMRASELQGDCAASDLQWRESETERKKRGMTYPINVARNVARAKANTVRVLVSDIELLPSDRLASGFVDMVRVREPKVGVIFVVPVFEIEANEQPPATKRELLAAAKAGVAVYFHRFLCPHCQRFPGLTRWMIRPDPRKVKPLIITRREYPHHRWEPVFIGTKDDPLYTEDMSWEGKQDKMAQMFEMCLLNYRIIVLDGAFLVHTPGIKHRSLKFDSAGQESFRLQERRNARIYQRVIKRLLQRYPSNHRCAQ